MREEILSPSEEPIDQPDEPGLRPRNLSEFVGQSELKGHLGVLLGAARLRREPTDHMLFAGPPGLGKTTLANIVAAEMDANSPGHVRSGLWSGPEIWRRFCRRWKRATFFSLTRFIACRGRLRKFSTRPWRTFGSTLSWERAPRPVRFRSSCLLSHWLEPPPAPDSSRDRSATVSVWSLVSTTTRSTISERSPFGRREFSASTSPRRARWKLRADREAPRVSPTGYCAKYETSRRSNATRKSSSEVAADGLTFFGVDELGLDKASRAVLESICERFGGGPVGLSTLVHQRQRTD